jgi:NADPH-dependent 2,4-dienoyl-CoA reductase/sulfur reductase-like enzyme
MRYVIIGGGIAGVCCVEELCRLRPADTVTLISSSTVLKVRGVVCVRVLLLLMMMMSWAST